MVWYPLILRYWSWWRLFNLVNWSALLVLLVWLGFGVVAVRGNLFVIISYKAIHKSVGGDSKNVTTVFNNSDIDVCTWSIILVWHEGPWSIRMTTMWYVIKCIICLIMMNWKINLIKTHTILIYYMYIIRRVVFTTCN